MVAILQAASSQWAMYPTRFSPLSFYTQNLGNRMLEMHGPWKHDGFQIPHIITPELRNAKLLLGPVSVVVFCLLIICKSHTLGIRGKENQQSELWDRIQRRELTQLF